MTDAARQDAPLHRDSILFITLDSCRFDTFEFADVPALKSVSALYAAQAPSHFTYGSHAAMFAGFTPGIASLRHRFLNPKYARLFRLAAAGAPGHAPAGFEVAGRDIVDGFARAGYRTIGTGAMRWFSGQTRISKTLTGSFQDFNFAGREGVAKQVAWMRDKLAGETRPVFAFLNVGETHVPYHYEGAPWSFEDNPAHAFQEEDRSADCRLRQRACCEYADRQLAPLIAAFRHATILLCGDHGDCWGEDGLWEHGFSHPMTLTVPLLIRYRGQPVDQLAG